MSEHEPCRRRDRRETIATEVFVTRQNGETFTMLTCNLSSSGALLEHANDDWSVPTVDERVLLKLVQEGVSANLIEIKIYARVVRIDANAIAVEFLRSDELRAQLIPK